jgi:cytochrome P450
MSPEQKAGLRMTPDILRYPLQDDSPSRPGGGYARLRHTRPVVRVALPSGDQAWMVTRYDDVRTVLSDPRFSNASGGPRFTAAEGPSPSGTLMTTDPPEHTRLRRLIGKAFTPRRVAAFRPAVERIAAELLDGMRARTPPADLIEELAPLPLRVVCEFLGIPPDRPGFHPWAQVVASVGGHTADQIAAAHRAGQRQVADLAAEKRERPGDDLLSALIQARDGGQRLSGRELVGLAWAMVVAGQETTVSLIGTGVVRLLGHPDQLEMLRAHPVLLPSAIEEILRYDGPAERALFRVATQDVQLSGGTIPRGEAVMAIITSANHDENRFADPVAFRIARADNQHLGFGYGPHFCPGAALARLEAEVALARLIDRFPRLRLAVPAEEILWRRMSTRGPVRLPVTWT